jgi:Transcriptional regulator containing an amidase domain and an AraC-type DNA-binding HTH domain
MKTIAALASESCMASGPRLFSDMATYADRAMGGGTLCALVATPDGRAVEAFGGARIEAEAALRSLDGPLAPPSAGRRRIDCLCLPVPLGRIERLYADPRIATETHRLAAEGALVAAPCASVFVLAEAGLLAGRSVPVHPNLAAQFADRYLDVAVDSGTLFREEPDFIASVGAASMPELGALVIRRLCGKEAAEAAARVFLDRDGSSRLAAIDFDDDASRAALLIERNYASELRLRELAAELGLEERTLARRFEKRYGMSPAAYQRLARCKAAADYLASTDLPAAEIGWRVGYAEPASFARAFKSVFGITPGEARRRR